MLKILQPFAFSANGIDVEHASDESVARVPADLIPGLIAGGFLALVSGGEVAAPSAAPTAEPGAPDTAAFWGAFAAEPAPTPAAEPAPIPAAEPSPETSLSDADLRDSIKRLSGKAPGPATKRPALLSQFQALTKG